MQKKMNNNRTFYQKNRERFWEYAQILYRQGGKKNQNTIKIKWVGKTSVN